MKAVTWQGKQHVSVETVPDPVIEADTDIIIDVTTTGLCGWRLGWMSTGT